MNTALPSLTFPCKSKTLWVWFSFALRPIYSMQEKSISLTRTASEGCTHCKPFQLLVWHREISAWKRNPVLEHAMLCNSLGPTNCPGKGFLPISVIVPPQTTHILRPIVTISDKSLLGVWDIHWKSSQQPVTRSVPGHTATLCFIFPLFLMVRGGG